LRLLRVHRLGEGERPLVERGADDDGRGARLATRPHVVQRRDATAGDDGDLHGVGEAFDAVGAHAVACPLHVHVGEEDGRRAEVGVPPRGLDGVEARPLGPSRHDHLVAFRVEADDDASRSLLADLADDVGILDGGCPENHPVDAPVEEGDGVLGGADAAAELHGHVHGVDDGLNGVGVGAFPLEGAVEVDQMEGARAGVDPPRRRLDGVAVARLGPSLSLYQLHHLAVLHVDGGNHLERRELGHTGAWAGRRPKPTVRGPPRRPQAERICGPAVDSPAMELFGSSGTRGVVGETFTPTLVRDVSAAAAAVWDADRVAVARDTRDSGEAFTDVAAGTLTAAGADVDRLGILPTPAVSYYCEREGVPAVHVTASHNPPEYNGIKLLGADGTELSVDGYGRVEGRIFGETESLAAWDAVGTSRPVDGVAADYRADMRAGVDTDAIADADLTVAIDPGHGAGSAVSPDFVRELGCAVRTVNADPDGRFPGRDPEPVPENLGALRRLVRSTDADVGVAHDGDADRAIFVDETGTMIDGDTSFAALAAAELSAGDTVVAAVNVSQRVVDAVVAAGAGLELTPIGAAHIVTRVRKCREAGQNVPIAGEGNGGVFFPGHRLTRDGPYIAAKFLERLAAADAPASEVVAPYAGYHLVRDAVEYDGGAERDRLLDAAEAYARDADADLNTTDGYRLDYGDAWVLVRPSGTEPKVRIYAEAREKERAATLVDDVRAHLTD